ncbi:MAG: hypothetical protein IKA76_04390 [Clostridia bacterium]|nr:hypothetical protein [Clostridia bacterium]
MKKNLDRALNVFSAMERIPDEFVLSAERMLFEAEAGIARPAKPMGALRRFVNSGWGAAAVSVVVALGALAFMIRAGHYGPDPYDPSLKPVGGTVAESGEGVSDTDDTLSALTTIDPDKMVVQGVFFWANGAPYVHLPSMGDLYPVHLSLENGNIDLTGLTSGDVVEAIIANRIEETFPCRGRLYEIRKISDGSMEDLPEGLAERMQEMGYTVTEAAAPHDFAIRLEVWINGSQRNILDTYEGYIQKDLVADGVSRQAYTPSYAEKCQLYYAVLALVENTDLDFSRPVTYNNCAIYQNAIYITPLTCYSLQFTANGKTLVISGDATAGECIEQSDEAKYFMEAVREISRFYRNTEEYKSMPEANGGYE